MKKLIPILLLTALLLSACAGSGSGDKQAAQSESPAVDTAETLASDHTVITLNGESAEIRGGGARDEGASVTISAAGTYEITGRGDKAIVVDTGDDPMDVTVVLNDASVTCLSGPALHVRQAGQFRLQLAGQNSLVSGTEDMLQNLDPEASGGALYSEDDMDIEGDGSLTVCGYLNNGIACKKDLDLNSGSITVLAANNGVKGNNSVQVKGGSLSVSAWGDGIKATTLDKEGKGYVEISGGTVTVESWSDGVQAATELRITGGSLSVTARGDGVENSSKALKAGSLILLSDGLVSLNSQEDALRCSEGSVSITGGTLDILCLSDGIQAGEKDSGLGDVTVSGGDLRISAGNRAIKAQGSFSVTGGSIRALCGSEKQNPATGSPCLLCLISGAQGDSLQIGDLESIQARQDYTCLLLVREGLNAGAQITVSNGSGSITATVK